MFGKNGMILPNIGKMVAECQLTVGKSEPRGFAARPTARPAVGPYRVTRHCAARAPRCHTVTVAWLVSRLRGGQKYFSGGFAGNFDDFRFFAKSWHGYCFYSR
jgi:hypothetical protein